MAAIDDLTNITKDLNTSFLALVAAINASTTVAISPAAVEAQVALLTQLKGSIDGETAALAPPTPPAA